ncbi:MAG TPA: wax ester/triacylglycerol synthase family O-acyltransferase [Acidimicrobiales bacterium]|nr:wax ester/triacylglycerol synthase family O-acyltransferase [Acidimicrobiales bacterium]
MDRLNGLDATWLYIETPKNQLHMTGLLVFDPSTMPGGYSFEKMRAFMGNRLERSPTFTRKVMNVPFRISHPVWVEDPDFNLEAHIHHVGCPAPGGAKELSELAGEIAGVPLDRNRPLWEMWFIEGLENGYVGLVAKMHHATIDGVSGANLMMHIFDLEPNPVEESGQVAPRTENVPSELSLFAGGVLERARQPLLLPSTLARTAAGAFQLVRRRRRPGTPSMATPFTAPATPFNRPITAHRRVAFTEVSLADVREVKDRHATTVNDVVLAVCAGAVRRWLEARDALPDKPLIAGVPVSTRGDEAASMGNLISAMFVSLATNFDDPVERLLAIREATKGAKEEFKAIGADALQDWVEFSGPRLFGLAMRLYSQLELADRHPPALNFLVSNVPGPPIPLYVAGGRLVSLFPMGPIFDGMGLNITVLSYMEKVGFGFVACRELIPDLWEIADAVPAALEELKSAGRPAASKKPETPGKAARRRPASV